MDLKLRSIDFKQCQDQCHPYIDAVLRLTEVGSSWIIIHFDRDLIDTREWVEEGAYVRLLLCEMTDEWCLIVEEGCLRYTGTA